MVNLERNAPWASSYGDVPAHIEYPPLSMYDLVAKTAEECPNITALYFMGKKISFARFIKNVEKVAKSFAAIGVKAGMTVTLCMPNVPQAIYCLYALNHIGAIASMVHPLSAEKEIVYYMQTADSRIVVTLKQFYAKLIKVMRDFPVEQLIIADIADELPPVKSAAYWLTVSQKMKRPQKNEKVFSWRAFLAAGRSFKEDYAVHTGADDPAVILFSGGTTGVSKGILLSNLNFNSTAIQTVAMSGQQVRGTRMLAAMPIFHGFGLGVCIHTIMISGGTAILVPQVKVKEYAEMIRKHKPNFIAGVPTLYENIIRNPYLDGVDLSFLKGVFSGGDSLSIPLKKRFDKWLEHHGATVRVREGYGATECVTACCLTPYNKEKEGSIGIPFPDTYFKICKPGTDEEVQTGELGEICISGPCVMKEYIGQPKETNETLKQHADGYTWLHTGDIGCMDEDGFIYFKQRLKRMIISSGYNVYPSQLENVLDGHDAVEMSCVIGVPDPYKIQKVKAFVVLKPEYEPSEEMKTALFAYLRQYVAKYAMPYDIEFRTDLPKTRIGKIAYTELEKEVAESAVQ